MEEEWKDIEGYEGLYQVSNLGRIKSVLFRNRVVSKKQDKILKCIHTKDYDHINLYKNGKQTQYLIHKIVAKTFIPNPKNKPEINHIDGNKQNNNAENLEWCTRSENQIHAYKTGLQKPRKGYESKLKKPVNQYDLNGNFIKRWDSIVEALQCYGKHLKITDVCKKKKYCKTAGGFKWEYAKAKENNYGR